MVYENLDKPRRVLVVESDPQTSELIEDYLTDHNYEVTLVRTPQEARANIAENGFPHIMVVDAVQPGMEGLALCEELRAEDRLFPVIVITADDSEAVVVRALQTADDYVVKPVQEKILLLRIQNILRRIADFSYAVQPPIQINDRIVVDPLRRRVIVDGIQKALTPTELGLLMMLLKHRGEPVDSSTLISNVWWFSEDIYEDTLRVHIHRLRKKIEVNPKDPQMILTERGIGYSLHV